MYFYAFYKGKIDDNINFEHSMEGHLPRGSRPYLRVPMMVSKS